MSGNDIICGYLDVKISSRSRRGLTPWRAWQRQWCEIKRLDGIENGAELKFKSSSDGSVLSCVVLPRSSTICRTESRTKHYAFGVFTIGRNQKPLLFLSGVSETDSQEWMSSIRKALSVATYLPVGKSNFHVSLIDSEHSRAAGLVGLYGTLGTNTQEIFIKDSCTGETKISWRWYQFHQFHLQASAHPCDDKTVCVLHTSREFPTGPGQLYFYCHEAERLLNHLVARGKSTEPSTTFLSSKRLSRSEGDLCAGSSYTSDGAMGTRYQSGSDDSGVRVSVGSDDSETSGLKNKISSSLASLGMGVLSKTPGGSETNDDSIPDLSVASTEKCQIPRPESGVSLASGVYEEISENTDPNKQPNKTDPNPTSLHVYENPLDIILKDSERKFNPPPLPHRNVFLENGSYTLTPKKTCKVPTPYKQRCSTLPARDLTRLSQMFTSDSDYVVMSPGKNVKPKISAEGVYMPMSPVTNLKVKFESYIALNAKK